MRLRDVPNMKVLPATSELGRAGSLLQTTQGEKPLHLGKLLAMPGLAPVQGPSQGTLDPMGSSCRVRRRDDDVPPGTQSLFLQSRKFAAK